MSTTASFPFRALEFHSARMWQWAQVERALDFMHAHGLNALIFHQNDIVEHLVFPLEFFPDELMWKRWPVRMHSIYQNRHYINKVVREAAEGGIGFYLEIKEIWYVDELIELVPGLRNGEGNICPTNPFWWRFLDIKMRELIAAVPGLAGIIVSPGTRESKVSIATNSCTCARCQSTDPVDWYAALLRAMHTPLVEHGKTLAVRDFSYTADQQSRMITAAGRCSPDVVISLKNTPHDYYPTFPDNPRIGNTGGLRQWVEYDTWGQFFGMGVFPVSVVEDMQRRFRHALRNGVEGVSLRTDWEVITDAGAFNSPNVVNVIAGAMLAQDVELELAAVYDRLARYGLYSPMRSASCLQTPVVPTARDAARRLEAFLKASWAVMEKAAYVRGHLFHEDDQYPDTVAKAFAMMVDIHGRDEWEPGASRLVEPTADNIAVILEEKATAVREVLALPAIFDVATLGIPAQAVSEFQTMLKLYAAWVRGFECCARAVFLVRSAQFNRSSGSLDEVVAAVSNLREFKREVSVLLANTHYPHYVYWLLDTGRIDSLAQDVELQTARLRQPASHPTLSGLGTG
jgi:hypothetical protein